MALVSRVGVVCGLALLIMVSPAAAGWKRVYPAGGNAVEIGVARTSVPGAPGQLNVLWSRDKTVYNTQIASPDGTIGDPIEVFTYDDPAGGASGALQLLRTPDGGLRAFFSGLYPNHPLDVGLATATSPDGKAWTVQPTLASDGRTGQRSSVYVAAGIGGTIANSGTPISIWGDSAPGQAGYHVGTSNTTDDIHFGGSSATVGHPNAATDTQSGRVVIGWNDLDSASTLLQSITPAGGRVTAPGGHAPDATERVAMTGRDGAGIFVAYLRGKNVFSSRPAVWRFGAGKAILLSSKRGARFPGVARAGSGRLWAFWARRVGERWRIYATRSNKTATRFGATVKLKPPKGTDSLLSLEGDGTRGESLDLLALSQRSPKDTSNWYRLVHPGLTLLAKVLGDGKVRFTTLDAGDRQGTTITFAGKTADTGTDGQVTMSADPGRHVARATAGGWTTATRVVKVR